MDSLIINGGGCVNIDIMIGQHHPLYSKVIQYRRARFARLAFSFLDLTLLPDQL